MSMNVHTYKYTHRVKKIRNIAELFKVPIYMKFLTFSFKPLATLLFSQVVIN